MNFSLIPKVFDSTRLLFFGIVYSFLPHLSLTASQILLLRTCLYELDPHKTKSEGLLVRQALSNRMVLASFSGIVSAQIILVLSIYCSSIYWFGVKPQIAASLMWPYSLFYSYKLLWYNRPLRFFGGEYISYSVSEISSSFLQSFIGQIVNPIVWPTPVFSRLMNILLFRYSASSMFLTGTVLGCLSGHFTFLIICCLFVVIIDRSTPPIATIRRLSIFFDRFFQYLAVISILSFASISPILTFRANLPLLQINSIRLRDPWPNLLFDSVVWHRPFWYPVALKLPEMDNIHIQEVEQENKVDVQTNTKNYSSLHEPLDDDINDISNDIPDYIEDSLDHYTNVDDLTSTQLENDILDDTIIGDDDTADETNKLEKIKKPRELVFFNRKKFSQYFFKECVQAGKLRLAYDFPESIAVSQANLEIILDIPYLSQCDQDNLFESWMESKKLRQEIIANNLVERMIAINNFEDTYDNLSDKKTITIVDVQDAKNSKDDNKLADVVPNNIDLSTYNDNNSVKDDIENEDIQNVVDHLDLRYSQLLLSGPIHKKQRVHDSRPLLASALNLTGKTICKLTPEPSLHDLDHISASNKLKQFLLMQSEQLNDTLTIPWENLSNKSLSILPNILNNQEVAKDVKLVDDLNWVTFVDLYASPMPAVPPEAPVKTGSRWGIFFDFGIYLCKYNLQWFKKNLKLIPNNSILEHKLTDLQELQKSVPLLNMFWENMNNAQEEPDIGIGKLPTGFNFNRTVNTLNMIPMKRKSGILNWYRQFAPLSPLLFHVKDLTSKLHQSDAITDNSYRYTLMRRQQGNKDVVYLGTLLNRIRGPLLILQAYFRRSIKLPLLIIAKNAMRMLFWQKSELSEDFRELAEETYIFCTYEGIEAKEEIPEKDKDKEKDQDKNEEKVTAKAKGKKKLKDLPSSDKQPEVSEEVKGKKTKQIQFDMLLVDLVQFAITGEMTHVVIPPNWWDLGIQVKVINPFHIQAWRVPASEVEEYRKELLDKLLKQFEANPEIVEYIHSRATSKTLENFAFLTLFGEELEMPGGNKFARPAFWRPIVKTILFLLRQRMNQLLLGIKFFVPGWQGLYKLIFTVYRKILNFSITFYQSIKVVVQSLVRTFMELKNQFSLLKGDMVSQHEQISDSSESTKKVQKDKQKYKKRRKSRRFEEIRYEYTKPIIGMTFLELVYYALPVTHEMCVFPILRPLPKWYLDLRAPRDRALFEKRFKSIQLKMVRWQLSKYLPYFRILLWNLITIEFPMWIELKIRILPTQIREFLIEISYWFKTHILLIIDYLVTIKENLQNRYIIWKYRDEVLEDLSGVEKSNFPLTEAYIFHKIWETKLPTNPYLTSINTNWTINMVLQDTMNALLKREGILAEQDQVSTIKYEHWSQWVQNLPHLSCPETVWSTVIQPGLNLKQKYKTLMQHFQEKILSSYPTSNLENRSLSSLHHLLISGAKNWSKRWRWYQLIKNYTNQNYGLRVPQLSLSKNPQLQLAHNSDIKSYEWEFLESDQTSTNHTYDTSITYRNNQVRITDYMHEDNNIDVVELDETAKENYFVFSPVDDELVTEPRYKYKKPDKDAKSDKIEEADKTEEAGTAKEIDQVEILDIDEELEKSNTQDESIKSNSSEKSEESDQNKESEESDQNKESEESDKNKEPQDFTGVQNIKDQLLRKPSTVGYWKQTKWEEIVSLALTSITKSKLGQISIPALKLYVNLVFGKDLRSLDEIEDILDNQEMQTWQVVEPNLIDWRPKYMNDKLFLYNLIGPLLEFADSEDIEEVSYVQDYIRWLLDESDKFVLCRLYDHIMLPDTQKEFRVLNLLNIDIDSNNFECKEKVRNLTQILGDSEHRLMERFLWPAHRIEDLACMNRFWFGSSNQSKFSSLRTSMYPLVKS